MVAERVRAVLVIGGLAGEAGIAQLFIEADGEAVVDPDLEPQDASAPACCRCFGGGDEPAGEPLAACSTVDGEGLEAGNRGVAAEQQKGIGVDLAVRRDGDEEVGARGSEMTR